MRVFVGVLVIVGVFVVVGVLVIVGVLVLGALAGVTVKVVVTEFGVGELSITWMTIVRAKDPVFS